MSEHITSPAIEEAYEGFSETRNDVAPDFLSDKEEESKGFWLTRMAAQTTNAIKEMRDKITNVRADLENKIRDMFIWTIKIVAGYIFDVLVFPFLIFFLLLKAVRFSVKYLFNLNREVSFMKNIESLILKKDIDA